ncbi:ribonuclease HI family protein [Patescibacteria group bacterium]
MKNKHLNIFTDGGSRGNPGPAAIGVVIKDESGNLLHQFGKTIGKATNNIAEYEGVIQALQWLVDNRNNLPHLSRACRGISFFLDSALVANQLSGLWKVKDANLRKKVIQVRELEGTLSLPIKYTPISREKNYQADALLNQALDKA